MLPHTRPRMQTRALARGSGQPAVAELWLSAASVVLFPCLAFGFISPERNCKGCTWGAAATHGL